MTNEIKEIILAALKLAKASYKRGLNTNPRFAVILAKDLRTAEDAERYIEAQPTSKS